MKHLIIPVLLLTFFLHEIHSYIVRDLEPAESQSKTEFKKKDGTEYQEAQHSAEGEKGSEGYAGRHEEENGKKGYHDIEGHKKHYAEAGKILVS